MTTLSDLVGQRMERKKQEREEKERWIKAIIKEAVSSRRRWEYRLIKVNDYDQIISILRKYGKQGWEAVSVINLDRVLKVLLKRPKKEN